MKDKFLEDVEKVKSFNQAMGLSWKKIKVVIAKSYAIKLIDTKNPIGTIKYAQRQNQAINISGVSVYVKKDYKSKWKYNG